MEKMHYSSRYSSSVIFLICLNDTSNITLIMIVTIRTEAPTADPVLNASGNAWIVQKSHPVTWWLFIKILDNLRA